MLKKRTTTDSIAGELKQLRAFVAEQANIIEQLRQRSAELEARLAKDSHNSSTPPSSDPPFRKPPRSQRKASERKPGGQTCHKRATRALVDAPEHLVAMVLQGACAFGRCRSQIDIELLPERRRVFELVNRREVTECRTVAGTCVCGRRRCGDFPEDAAATPQYGPGVSMVAVYMAQYQLLRLERAAAVLDKLAGIAISPGSLLRMVPTSAARVQAPVAVIARSRQSPRAKGQTWSDLQG